MARISIITPDPLSVLNGRTRGGVDRFTVLLRQMLERHGHTVSIAGPNGRWRSLPSALAALQPWDNALDENTDLVIANSPFGLQVPEGVRMVFVAHGIFAGSARVKDATPKEKLWRRFAAAIEAASCRRANHVVAVSEFVGEMLTLHYRRNDPTVILNAVDTQFWSPGPFSESTSDAPCCLFAGPPIRSKGFDLFVSLAERFAGRVRFICALSSPPQRHISGPLQTHVALNEEELRHLLRCADFLLFPSHFEGCPYVLIESWACGLPTISSPVGHVPELARRHAWLNEFLVPSFDEANWIRRVERILDELALPHVRREIGMQFRTLALQYHSLPAWEAQWSQIIQQSLL